MEIQTNLLRYYNYSNLRGLYVYMRSLRKGAVKKLLIWANSKKFGIIDLDLTLQFILLGYCAGYYEKPYKPKSTESVRVTANFVNKGFDFIHFEKLVTRDNLKQLAPSGVSFPKVILSYRLNDPVSLKLCNYGRELSKFSTRNLKIFEQKCNCTNSPFNYAPSGHIITGDLSIIGNKDLQRIFSMGTKFREDYGIDWEELEKELFRLSEAYIIKIARFNKIDKSILNQYKLGLVSKIKDRILYLSGKYPGAKLCSIFSQFHIKNKLRELHDKYVICCADKTANNYVFVCKFYYLRTLCNELGITLDHTTKTWKASGNNTYSVSNLTQEDVVKIHKNFTVNSTFDLHFGDEIGRIPRIHCLPKLHKNPYGFRFICAAGHTSIMPLSKLLHYAQTHLRNHFNNHCKVIWRRTGKNCYWSVSNNEPVVRYLSQSAMRVPFQEANSFDFSTLFTKLPHDVVEEQMEFLIDKMFGNNGHRSFIAIRKDACIRDSFQGGKITFYTNSRDRPNEFTYLSSEDVKQLVRINLQHSYTKFGEYVFKQDYGISMGGSASPMTCDLTLSILEYRFMTNPINQNKTNELKFVFRYIDDILCTSCSSQRFLELAREIYPDSLPLNHASGNGTFCDFLDLRIHHRPEFKIDVYNKTDYFNFKVVKFIYSESNVPSNLGYNIFYSQVVRVSRICTKINDFRSKIRSMVETFVLHGFDKHRLLLKFLKFANNCPINLLKFKIIDRKDTVTFCSKVF
ncbi:MAG: hypothetical protein GY739_05270 [Mesoflavibacter sp.]|nr:hypothetical protein [Mesoflavibacter sp.]